MYIYNYIYRLNNPSQSPCWKNLFVLPTNYVYIILQMFIHHPEAKLLQRFQVWHMIWCYSPTNYSWLLVSMLGMTAWSSSTVFPNKESKCSNGSASVEPFKIMPRGFMAQLPQFGEFMVLSIKCLYSQLLTLESCIIQRKMKEMLRAFLAFSKKCKWQRCKVFCSAIVCTIEFWHVDWLIVRSKHSSAPGG